MQRLLTLGVLSLLALPAHAEEGWKVAKRKEGPEGFVLYERRIEGSDALGYRLEAELDAPPKVVFAAQALPEDPPSRTRTERLLRREGNVTFTYMTIKLPVVADRDLVMRTERQPDPKRDVYRVRWHTANAEAPPLPDGVVRVQRSEGGWEFTPIPGGHTRAVFESHSELGGSIPSWIVNSVYRGIVIEEIEELRRAVDRVAAGSEPPKEGTR